MKILVCISHVPDTTSKISFSSDATAFNSSGLQFVVNPYDEIALAKAVEIAQSQNGEITVINVGESETEPTIRKALAIGADKAIRVNAKPKDGWFVANQIASHAKDNAYDLILTGRESIDYNGTQIAALVGELLGIPSVSLAKKLQIENGKAQIDREIENGVEKLEINLPLTVGTSEGVAEPKIPNIRNIMGARSKTIEVVEPIEVSELSSINDYELPQPRESVTMIQADQVEELVNLLHSKSKVI